MSVNQQQSEDAQLPSFVAPRSKITIKLTETQEVLAAPRSKITIKLPEMQEIIAEKAHAPIDETTMSLLPATPLAFPVPDLLPDDVLSLLKTELLPEPEERELALNTTTGDDITALPLSMLLLDDELTGPMVPAWHTDLQPPVTPPLRWRNTLLKVWLALSREYPCAAETLAAAKPWSIAYRVSTGSETGAMCSLQSDVVGWCYSARC